MINKYTNTAVNSQAQLLSSVDCAIEAGEWRLGTKLAAVNVKVLNAGAHCT